MKSQVFTKNQPQKRVQVIDNRVPKEGQEMRTVLYVEAGNTPIESFKELVSQVARSYEGDNRSIHYILPVRNGKIGAEVFFEKEWLEVVKKTCVVNEAGEIVLKDGAKDVLVRREYI